MTNWLRNGAAAKNAGGTSTVTVAVQTGTVFGDYGVFAVNGDSGSTNAEKGTWSSSRAGVYFKQVPGTPIALNNSFLNMVQAWGIQAGDTVSYVPGSTGANTRLTQFYMDSELQPGVITTRGGVTQSTNVAADTAVPPGKVFAYETNRTSSGAFGSVVNSKGYTQTSRLSDYQGATSPATNVRLSEFTVPSGTTGTTTFTTTVASGNGAAFHLYPALVLAQIAAAPTVIHATSATINCKIPAAAPIGSLLMIVLSNGTNSTIGIPAGWTAAPGSVITGAGSYLQNLVFYKTCVSGDPGSTVSISMGTTSKSVVIGLSIAGVDTTNPIDAQSFSGYTTQGTVRAIPTSTAVADSFQLVVAFDRAAGTLDQIASTTFDYPSGFTEVVKDRVDATVGAGATAISVAVGPDVAAGGTAGGGNVTYQYNNTRAGVWTLTLKKFSTAVPPNFFPAFG